MWNRIEIPFQVRIVNGLIARLQMRLYFLQGIMGRPSTSESVITIQKVRFEDRFQNQKCRHLDDAIPNRRDAPVAAAFHSLSRSIHDAPLPAGMFSASAPARFRPEIAVLRLRSPQ